MDIMDIVVEKKNGCYYVNGMPARKKIDAVQLAMELAMDNRFNATLNGKSVEWYRDNVTKEI